jgi:hypothetical protein
MAISLPPGSIVFDCAEAVAAKGIAFDVWHANHHLPALRAQLSGASELAYASASLRSLTYIFELGAGLAMRDLPAAEAHPSVARIERFAAVPLGAGRKRDDACEVSELPHRTPIMYAVFFGVPAARTDEFDRWYEDEHMPILLKCEQWLGYRRFRLETPHPDGHTHLAVHYLADLRALESSERDVARSTPWRNRLVAEGWFKGEYRVNYRLSGS